ncbi:MAG TPA: YceI family protein [Candidatus Polarisedimenticolia bacterium]|jgi:polyisoprenoid-binding protein YceI|nr:YceI family protein [Candidatus Polarisedimenticolia bacterium]
MRISLSIRLAVLTAAILSGACGPPVSEKSEFRHDNGAGVVQASNPSSGARQNPAGSAAPAGRYKVIAANSRMVAAVASGGMFSKLGHDHAIALGGLTGEVELAPGDEKSSLRLTIEAGTAAETGKEFDEKDRAKVNQAVREEALETGKYPQIAFKSTRIVAEGGGAKSQRYRITGELTLHGVTNRVEIPAQVRVSGNRLQAHADFVIFHTAYGIKRLSAVGGTIKAKNPIRITCDVVAEKE